MKKPGAVMEFIQMRNQDLLDTYKRIVASSDFIVAPDIFEKVANSPSKRFWVSEERATAVVKAMMAGKATARMNANRRRMFEEILSRVKAIMASEHEVSIADVVRRVLEMPAPCFYLTPRTVGEFLYRIRKRLRKK